MVDKELPIGFGMALALRPDAMKEFSNMSEEEQSKVLSQIHDINSKEEMQQFVEDGFRKTVQ